MALALETVTRRPAWPAGLMLGFALWVAVSLGVMAAAESAGRSFTLCHFKRWTGLPCPTCGTTRAAGRMLCGDPVGAWLCNPLIVTAGAGYGALLILRVLFGRRVVLRLSRRRRALAWAAAGVLVLANWAYLIRAGI